MRKISKLAVAALAAGYLFANAPLAFAAEETHMDPAAAGDAEKSGAPAAAPGHKGAEGKQAKKKHKKGAAEHN